MEIYPLQKHPIIPLLSTDVAAQPVDPKVHRSAPIISAATASQYSGSIIPCIWDSLREQGDRNSNKTVI